jgi:membrane complex biogenesis BtpA family protein
MISASKPNALKQLFGTLKVAIGVVHLPALPGSPGFEGGLEAVYKTALTDAERYAQGGIDGLIVENHGDIPFAKPADIGYETVATMSVIAARIQQVTKLPTGINVLANAAMPALAVAQASGSQFIRVNQWANAYVANEGFIEGEAARATRYRANLRAQHLNVFADVHVKHGAHAIVSDRDVSELTRDVEFFDADVVIATGQRTGDSAQLDEMRMIQQSTQLPLVVGSGATVDNISDILSVADGVIVASSLKEEGVWWTPVSQAKVRTFMDEVERIRRSSQG